VTSVASSAGLPAKGPASVIYRDEDVMALLDVNPVLRGHTPVIPKKHYVNIWDIDPSVRLIPAPV